MGMYTEIFVSARVKPGDQAVIDVLKYLTSDVEQPTKLPDHPLFSTDRWQWVLRGSSHYFVPRSVSLFDYDDIARCWVLIARSDIKNYGGEIEKFFDWLRPHLEAHKDEMIGYSRYEEDRVPTIYYGAAEA
jgi:hypothetical protein